MKKFSLVALSLLLALALFGCSFGIMPQGTPAPTPASTITVSPIPTPEEPAITAEMTQVVYDLLELNSKEYTAEELQHLKQSIELVKGPLSPDEIERLSQTNVQAEIDVLTEEELDQLIMDFFNIDLEALTELKQGFLANVEAVKIQKEAELKAELNKNIYDFLNYQGEFTEEKVQERTITIGFDDRYQGIEKLGIMRDTQSIDLLAYVQGESLGCFECQGDIISLIGFHDKDGERFVTPMMTTTSFYEKTSSSISFVVDHLIKPRHAGVRCNDEIMNSVDDIKGLLEKLPAKGGFIINLTRDGFHNFAVDEDSQVQICV